MPTTSWWVSDGERISQRPPGDRRTCSGPGCSIRDKFGRGVGDINPDERRLRAVEKEADFAAGNLAAEAPRGGSPATASVTKTKFASTSLWSRVAMSSCRTP